MDTQKIASDYKLTKWAQIIQARRASGMKIKEYCITSGIGETAYYYWQRKLRETALLKIAATPLKNIDADGNITPNGWVLHKPPVNRTAIEAALTIEIGDATIKVNAETDSELLTKVCRVLMNLC